jgi:hypothetical protein
MSRRRQQTEPVKEAGTPVAACGERVEASATGGAQDTPGVWGRARDDSQARNRRGPTRLPPSGEGGVYKPKAKRRRAGRESEGAIVPSRGAPRTLSEGRAPTLIATANGGKCEGMAHKAQTPPGKVRELQRSLFRAAKRSPGCALRRMVDTDFGRRWTAISGEAGQPFQAKVDTDFRGIWTGLRARDCQSGSLRGPRTRV